jgi:hypothetical protein
MTDIFHFTATMSTSPNIEETIPKNSRKVSQNLQAAPAQLSNKHGGGTSHQPD